MKDEEVKDVVCGMVKPKSQMKFASVYKGKTYYFCSRFDAHPDRWVGGENK